MWDLSEIFLLCWKCLESRNNNFLNVLYMWTCICTDTISKNNVNSTGFFTLIYCLIIKQENLLIGERRFRKFYAMDKKCFWNVHRFSFLSQCTHGFLCFGLLMTSHILHSQSKKISQDRKKNIIRIMQDFSSSGETLANRIHNFV